MRLPALRPVDAFPFEHDGQTIVCVLDPARIVEEQLFLTPPAMFVAGHLNGNTTADDIHHAFRAQFDGLSLPDRFVHEVVNLLDDKGFLQSDRFRKISDRICSEFRASETRPAYLAGKSYPAEPDALSAFLDEQFTRLGGPGERPAVNGRNGDVLPGLIVPHIDLHRGGHSYAHGYARLAQSGAPDTVVVFGVAHAAEPAPFILTRKHFETPLGTVETDLEVVDALAASCDFDPFAFEPVHRTEHSIEFHAVLLAHLFGPRVKMVPILCSMFGGDPGAAVDPDAVASITRFLDACRGAVRQSGKKVTVLAAADLAHVGRRFGDDYEVDDGVVAAVARRDREDIEYVLDMNAAGFYRSVMNDSNARKVCGINCIFAAVRALDGTATRGETLHYDYAHDPAGGIVSFASVALT